MGQTGTTFCPKVYIACGISRSVQHYAGMKTSALIIAINTDPDAAIIKRCDYFAVADLFDFEALNTALNLLQAEYKQLKGGIYGRRNGSRLRPPNRRTCR